MPEALAAEAVVGLLSGGEALAIGAGAEAFGAAALGAEALGGGLLGAEAAGLAATEALGPGALTAQSAAQAAGAGATLSPEFAALFPAAGGASLFPEGGTGGTFGGLEALSAAAPLSFGAAAVPAASTGAAFAFPSISQLGSGLNIASSLYGMSQADQMKKLAMLQANKASPWQSAGGADLASQQLMALISGQTDVSTLPGYKAGSQAVERRMAAQGFNGSGNMMAALQEYGGKFYNDAVVQLGGLAGTQFNPASSGAIAMGGFNNAAATNLAAMSNINKTIETQPAWR